MKILSELNTPSFLVDLTKMEKNISQIANLCKLKGKKLYPMIKTHKSSQIAKLQSDYGVDGFLVGTIDEAEMLVENGHQNIIFAYPIMCKVNFARVLDLTKRAKITLAIDSAEAAQSADEIIKTSKLDSIDYLIIVDCGLHRFGVIPNKVAELAAEISKYDSLCLKGISTHPGHVYGKTNMSGVREVAKTELQLLQIAKNNLEKNGFEVETVATGSTPTVFFEADSNVITDLRPGNYVFYDAIQIALGVVEEIECSFSVLASIVSHPKEDLFIIDAGSKCLGLDTGAHGVSLLNGYGVVKGHPELIVEGLSEEVAKVKIKNYTNLKVGDKIQIIPNHACASANMTSYVYGLRNDIVEYVINIDARGNSKMAK